jgi:hypothetical protein
MAGTTTASDDNFGDGAVRFAAMLYARNASMTNDQVARLADEIFRERLGSIGYDHVTVDFREDQGGDPAIYIDCNLVPNAPAFDVKAYTMAISVLHERLIERGDLRFPYVYTKHPDDEEPFDDEYVDESDQDLAHDQASAR